MIRLNQKGVIHLFSLLILLVGIVVGVYLVQHPAIFKPKANFTPPISIESFNTLGEALNVYEKTEDYKAQEEFNKQVARISKEQSYEKVYGQDRETLLKNIFDIPVETPGAKINNIIKNELEKASITLEGDINNEYQVKLPEGCFESLAVDGSGEMSSVICPEALYNLGSSVVEFIFGDIINLNRIYQKYAGLAQRVYDLFDKSGIYDRVNTSGIDFSKDNDLAIMNKFLEIDLKNHPDDSLSEDQKLARDEVKLIFPEFIQSGNDLQNEARNVYVLRTLFGKTAEAGGQLMSKLASTETMLSIGNSLRGKFYNLTDNAKKVFGLYKERWGTTPVILPKNPISFSLPTKYPDENKNIWDIVAKLMPQNLAATTGKDFIKPIAAKLVDRVESLVSRGVITGVRVERQQMMDVAENNWVIGVMDNVLAREFKLPANAGGFGEGRTVVMRLSGMNFDKPENVFTLTHEFVHILSNLIRGQVEVVGKHFTYGQFSKDRYTHIMSVLYERGTDELAGFTVGSYSHSLYKSTYPHIYNSIDNLVDYLAVYSNGRFTRADLMEFALTADDGKLLTKIFGKEDPQLMVQLMQGKINFATLEKLYQSKIARTNEIQNALTRTAGIIGSGPLINSNSQPDGQFSSNSSEDLYVYPPPYQADVAFFNSPDTSNLNCSYSEPSDNCANGFQVCSGYTDDEKCAGKTAEECFNLVHCNYDVSKGSSCSCSE